MAAEEVSPKPVAPSLCRSPDSLPCQVVGRWIQVESALPLAPLGSCLRGVLGFAALGIMKRPVADRTAKTPVSRRTARMATVTGGRHNVVKVRLSDRELGQLKERAERGCVSLQRFLFEAA